MSGRSYVVGVAIMEEVCERCEAGAPIFILERQGCNVRDVFYYSTRLLFGYAFLCGLDRFVGQSGNYVTMRALNTS